MSAGRIQFKKKNDNNNGTVPSSNEYFPSLSSASVSTESPVLLVFSLLNEDRLLSIPRNSLAEGLKLKFRGPLGLWKYMVANLLRNECYLKGIDLFRFKN